MLTTLRRVLSAPKSHQHWIPAHSICFSRKLSVNCALKLCEKPFHCVRTELCPGCPCLNHRPPARMSGWDTASPWRIGESSLVGGTAPRTAMPTSLAWVLHKLWSSLGNGTTLSVPGLCPHPPLSPSSPRRRRSDFLIGAFGKILPRLAPLVDREYWRNTHPALFSSRAETLAKVQCSPELTLGRRASPFGYGCKAMFSNQPCQ